MHPLALSLPFAGIMGLGLIELVLIGLFLLLPISVLIVVVGGVFALKHRQDRLKLWHETARLALEKGQPLPLKSPNAPTEPAQKGTNDFRTGLVLVGCGAGLWLFLGAFRGQEGLRYLGAIPGFIGIALLLHASLSALFQAKKPAADDRTPKL